MKSLTRSFLKALGLSDDQQTSILEQHTAVVDEIKQERDTYKADADKLPGLQQELDSLKNGEDFKSKYETEHQAFEDYKADQAKKEEHSKVESAYRKLLADEQINEKLLDDIVHIADIDSMKLDKDGNLQDIDTLKTAINEKYSAFKVKTEQRTHKPETPPKEENGGGNSEIKAMAVKWREARYGKQKET